MVFYCAACSRPFPAGPTDDPEILALALQARDEHQKECRGRDDPSEEGTRR